MTESDVGLYSSDTPRCKMAVLNLHRALHDIMKGTIQLNLNIHTPSGQLPRLCKLSLELHFVFQRCSWEALLKIFLRN